MKNIVACLLITHCFFSFPVNAQGEASPEAEAFFTKAMSQINPKHVAWVKNTAKTKEAIFADEVGVKKIAIRYAVSGSMNNQDIEALSFLVLMQASKSAQEDLKAIMAKVKSINEQKKKMREALATMQEKNSRISRIQLDSFTMLLIKKPATTTVQPAKTRAVTKAELDNVTDQMKNDLDSMSETGEMESLRLQMAMDRLSKMMSTLSNLLKKISKTAGEIVQNLK